MKTKINKLKPAHYVLFSFMGIVLVALTVGNVLCAQWSNQITNLLCGDGTSFNGEHVQNALTKGKELVENINNEGIVLLKNENKTLPLSTSETNVNLFGWASTDNGFLLTGGGSGAAPINDETRVPLKKGLEETGFKINEELFNKYTEYCPKRICENNGTGGICQIVEPDRSFYTDELINNAKNFSSIAIITIMRYGGEQFDIHMDQPKYKLPTDSSRTYLQISTEEEDMIDIVTKNFSKVIVLLNTSNPIETKFLQNDKIDACLFVGYPGQVGTKSIGNILSGKINPSGHVSSTYALDHKLDPTFLNSANLTSAKQLTFAEDIYYGYFWYETANEEGYFDNIDNEYGKGYDGVVSYPFGYGLSYTSFSWHVDSVTSFVDGTNDNYLNLLNEKEKTVTNRKAKIKVKVTVKNIGEVAGKEVVQCYITTPYYKGEIEKPYVKLMDYAKTQLLKPNEEQQVTLSFSIYDFASYDCYDKNNNGARTYELDKGEYQIKLMNDSHHLNICDKAVTTFNLENTMIYKRDPVTNQLVKNRFTGTSSYGNAPIDGKSIGEVTYLSREDFAGTFPKETTNLPLNKVVSLRDYLYSGYNDVEMPTQGQSGDLRLWLKEDNSNPSKSDLGMYSKTKLVPNEELIKTLANPSNFNNSQIWDPLLNQLTKEELCDLVEKSGFRTRAIESIGKKELLDYDGPEGFQYHFGSIAGGAMWTAYMGEQTLACTFNKELAFSMGRSVASEGNATGINGWYAPGVNLQRTPYTGRYFEYYSEDAYLSGSMASYVINGAKTNFMYCYLKHFTAYQSSMTDIDCFLTEQALREVYNRPFEIAVKNGANAIMSSFNSLGGIWTGANRALLTDILRTEWGFKGTVITDFSNGIGWMKAYQGVLAGNDIWLNPAEVNQTPLDKNSAAQMYAARLAAKNVIFTICDTYNAYLNYDATNDPFTAIIGQSTRKYVFPWWKPLLVGLDILIVASMGFTVYYILRPKKTKLVTNDFEITDQMMDIKNELEQIKAQINSLNLRKKELEKLCKNKSIGGKTNNEKDL